MNQNYCKVVTTQVGTPILSFDDSFTREDIIAWLKENDYSPDLYEITTFVQVVERKVNLA